MLAPRAALALLSLASLPGVSVAIGIATEAAPRDRIRLRDLEELEEEGLAMTWTVDDIRTLVGETPSEPSCCYPQCALGHIKLFQGVGGCFMDVGLGLENGGFKQQVKLFWDKPTDSMSPVPIAKNGMQRGAMKWLGIPEATDSNTLRLLEEALRCDKTVDPVEADLPPPSKKIKMTPEAIFGSRSEDSLGEVSVHADGQLERRGEVADARVASVRDAEVSEVQPRVVRRESDVSQHRGVRFHRGNATKLNAKNSGQVLLEGNQLDVQSCKGEQERRITIARDEFEKVSAQAVDSYYCGSAGETLLHTLIWFKQVNGWGLKWYIFTNTHSAYVMTMKPATSPAPAP